MIASVTRFDRRFRPVPDNFLFGRWTGCAFAPHRTAKYLRFADRYGAELHVDEVAELILYAGKKPAALTVCESGFRATLLIWLSGENTISSPPPPLKSPYMTSVYSGGLLIWPLSCMY